MGCERDIAKGPNVCTPTHHALATSVPPHGTYELNLCCESLTKAPIVAKPAKLLGVLTTSSRWWLVGLASYLANIT